HSVSSHYITDSYCIPRFPLLTHVFLLFFLNATATTEIYTLSLHDALPISARRLGGRYARAGSRIERCAGRHRARRDRESAAAVRSEEHTSELQSPDHLVCRLLLEKKKTHSHTPVLTRAAHQSITRAHGRSR